MRFLVLFLLFVPNLLLAECPVAEESRGIELVRHRPYSQTTVWNSPEETKEVVHFVENGKTQEETYFGDHPLAPGRRVNDKGETIFTFSNDVRELDDLPRLGTWSSPLSVVGYRGTTFFGEINYKFRKMSNLRVGRCKYKVWVVDERMKLEGERNLYRLYYAPNLRVVLRTEVRDPDTGRRTSTFRYDEIKLAE